MQLSDLFVSHKQVDPVSFPTPTVTLPPSIYLNSDRAHRVATEESEPTSAEEITDWRVQYITRPKESSNQTPSSQETWENPYKNNRQEWISAMTTAYKKRGLSNQAIKNLIAKNALESGWGSHAQGAYNFGNITTGKYWKGDYVLGNDLDADGNPIKHNFRSYKSIDDYVNDELQFLTNLYDFDPSDTFTTFINKLQGGNSGKRRYAEDRKYVEKVRGVYNSI